MGDRTAIDDTTDALVATALAADDARGFFPAMYARVTAHVADQVAAGEFDDPARMADLVATFAGFYLGTRRGEAPVPGCWQATFDVAGDGALLIVQHLLLGINAHVNHDLPQAVVAVADRTGDLGAVRPDFLAINEVLAATYVDLVADLNRVAHWVHLVDGLGAGRVFNFSLRVARDQAWGAAERLHPLDAGGRVAYAAELDRLVTYLAYLVTRPVLPFSLLVPLARLFERRDPREVTAALLGERLRPA